MDGRAHNARSPLTFNHHLTIKQNRVCRGNVIITRQGQRESQREAETVQKRKGKSISMSESGARTAGLMVIECWRCDGEEAPLPSKRNSIEKEMARRVRDTESFTTDDDKSIVNLTFWRLSKATTSAHSSFWTFFLQLPQLIHAPLPPL